MNLNSLSINHPRVAVVPPDDLSQRIQGWNAYKTYGGVLTGPSEVFGSKAKCNKT